MVGIMWDIFVVGGYGWCYGVICYCGGEVVFYWFFSLCLWLDCWFSRWGVEIIFWCVFCGDEFDIMIDEIVVVELCDSI